MNQTYFLASGRTPNPSAGADSIGDWRGWHGFVGDKSRSKAEEPCNTCFGRHDNYGTTRFLTCAFASPCVMYHPFSAYSGHGSPQLHSIE